MSRSSLSATTDGLTIERLAARLDLSDRTDVARAALEAGAPDVGRYGNAATVAAVAVACRRSGRRTVDPEEVAALAGADPAAVELAVETLERELSPPAPAAEIRSLRQSIVVLQELLAAIEAGRSSAPRLSPTAFAAAEPTVMALAETPLERLDEAALQTHLYRLEADLEMARLGVELYALVRRAD